MRCKRFAVRIVYRLSTGVEQRTRCPRCGRRINSDTMTFCCAPSRHSRDREGEFNLTLLPRHSHMNTRNWIFGIVLLGAALGQAALGQKLHRVAEPEFFPACTQFSPVPSGKGWHGEEGPLTEPVMRATVDEILAHGFTGLESPVRRPLAEARFILGYAQSRGMIVVHHTGPLELFGRDRPYLRHELLLSASRRWIWQL